MILVQRYFFRQLLWPFLTSVGAFAGLSLLTQSLSNTDLVSGYSETAFTFFKVTLLALPHLTALLLPIALFVASLTGLSRLSSDSELVVTSASGMTRWGMLSPLLRLGVYVVIANLAINLFVQPISYREMRRSLYDLRSDVASSLVTPGAFSRIGEGVTIYARERSRDGRLLDIMIHDTRGQDGAVTYTAREGVIARGGNRTALVLINGNAQWLDENQEMNYTTFDRTEPDLEEFSGIADAIFFKESDRFLHELLWPDSSIRARPDGEERALAEAHYRLSAPLFNLAFILIAAAAYLAGDYSRLGYGKRIAIAVGAGLTLRLVGFSVQSGATDDTALNIAQYLVPVIGIIGALAVIYWPARSRPDAPPVVEAR